MKKILLIVILLLSISLSAFAEEIKAVDFLYEAGVVRGNGNGDIATEDYITYGEFATILSRIYKGADNYEKALNLHIGSEAWKECTLNISENIFRTDKMINTISEKFYEKISPDFASEMLRLMFIHSYVECYKGEYHIPEVTLSDFGYDVSLIPDGEYITRGQACEMAAGILYIAFPTSGCWNAESAWGLSQYTLDGIMYLMDGGTNDPFDGVIAAIELAKKGTELI